MRDEKDIQKEIDVIKEIAKENTIKEYKVVSEPTEERLSDEVNKLLSEGWGLYGNVEVACALSPSCPTGKDGEFYRPSSHIIYAQTLVMTYGEYNKKKIR